MNFSENRLAIITMTKTSVQDILPFVENPSRYIGTEINVVRKDHDQVDLHVALAFPDLYDIGTSHFGMQILYHRLNQRPDTVAERVFAPGVDMARQLSSQRVPLTTLESGRALRDFDIIGFSLLYELNYTNVLTMLELSDIAFLAEQRGTRDPLVIAGGPCTCNPEPMADFFDAIVVGDGEKVLIEMVEAWKAWKKQGADSRHRLLRQWSTIDGVYVPSFFSPVYDANGAQHLQPRYDDYDQVKRAVIGDLDRIEFPAEPIVPFGKPVHDRLRLEVARGCTRGCRFCQAGMIYRPVRERSVGTLLELAKRSLKRTGYEDISLLSLSTGDYSGIQSLMQALMDRCAADHVAVSLPSLRAGTLTPEMMRLIQKVRKTGFTIAPEAGSQRLRDVINKNISEGEITETVANAFDLGWQVIKLYFMVGLPTETDDDVQAIIDLVLKLRKIKRPKGRRGQINVSVATFIPKPHTPFQWSAQVSTEDAHRKILRLQHALKGNGIQLKWQPPDISRLEGLWARGDRRLSRLLITAHKMGCRLDGWHDYFKPDKWQAACEKEGIDIEKANQRTKTLADPLPWDHIQTGVSKEFLWDEWVKALAGERTGDCRRGACNRCGVCDFNEIAPVVFPSDRHEKAVKTGSDIPSAASPTCKLMLTFSKTGPARFLGHLEMVNVFIRALRRAKVPMTYSQGFHPKPKLSFFDALPVGMESLQEHLCLSVTQGADPEVWIPRLNAELPGGIAVVSFRPLAQGKLRSATAVHTYRVKHDDGAFDSCKIDEFWKKNDWPVSRVDRKGRTKTVDLRKIVTALERRSESELDMTLCYSNGPLIRPGEIAAHLFDIGPANRKHLRIIKLTARFESNVAESVSAPLGRPSG